MTETDSETILVWDASPLLHAIKAERIDLLGDIARRLTGDHGRNVTTATVVEEIRFHDQPATGLSTWLEVVHVDGLAELSALRAWMEIVSSDRSNHGEATVFAWAQTNGGVAVVDDADARRAARLNHLPVRGSLGLIAQAVREGFITRYEAGAHIDALIDSGAWYPCRRGGFHAWAVREKLLPE